IIKLAMINLRREMAAAGVQGRLLLQVHDELLLEIPEIELSTFAEMVPRVMTGAYELLCGLEVEMKVGPNWAEMRRLEG
ncbi:MAG: DNA polymerase, partial [Candidatus Dormibacteraceae bacterium]